MLRGRIGIQIGATVAPEDIALAAKEAEALGYGELWMAEDYFQLGGIASVAIALGATKAIPVGLGVAAAAVRHPAVTAMEFATLGAAYPGRFMAGLGHGVAAWVRQMGLQPTSPLTLLREATAAVGELLGGAEVTMNGDYFKFDAVHPHHRAVDPVPVYLGVHGPASLRLSGELADGTLLGWFSSPGYVAWAHDRIEEGRRRSDRAGDHELVVLCVLSTSEDDVRRAAQDLWQWAAPMLASMTQSPQLQSSEQARELADFLAADAVATSAAMPPHQFFGEFAATGDLQSCAETVERLLEAGADRVVLVPNPGGYRSTPQMLEQMRLAAPLARIA